MPKNHSIAKWLTLASVISLTGCPITEEEKQKIEAAGQDLEKLASQIIITRPAKDAIVYDAQTVVLADLPSDAEVDSMALYVDGRKVAEDNDGAPWEFLWDSYYWADNNNHSLFLKATTSEGVEVRNNDPYQVHVSSEANEKLTFAQSSQNKTIQDADTMTIDFADVANATSYKLQVRSALSGNLITSMDVTDSEAVLENLSVGEYHISYRASWKFSELETVTGPWSDAITVAVLPPNLPTVDAPLTSYENGQYNVNLSWEDQGLGNSYEVFITQTVFNQNSAMNETTTIETMVTDTNTAQFTLGAGDYQWQLRRTNSLNQISLPSTPQPLSLGVFQKQFGGSGDEYGKKIIQTQDGNYVVLATTKSKGNPNGDSWIFKLDTSGNLLWEYVSAFKLDDIIQLTDGSLVAKGYSGDWSTRSALLIKLDNTGAHVWDKTYAFDSADTTRFHALINKDSTIITATSKHNCTTTRCTALEHSLSQININTGALIKDSPLTAPETTKISSLRSIALNTQNQLILALSLSDPACPPENYGMGCSGAGIAVSDENGNIEWQWHTKNDWTLAYGYKAEELPNGGYVLLANTEMADGAPLAFFDSNGHHTGTYTYTEAWSNSSTLPIIFSTSGKTLRLFEKSNDDHPSLIATTTSGHSTDLARFVMSSRYNSASGLTSTADGGLIMLFNVAQSGYNNYDLVVKKIGDPESTP